MPFTVDSPENVEKTIENVTYDEMTIGQTASQTRTLGQNDIAAFAAVSGDVNPAHIDAEYASKTLFHGVIAHGMWGAALISKLLGPAFPDKGRSTSGKRCTSSSRFASATRSASAPLSCLGRTPTSTSSSIARSGTRPARWCCRVSPRSSPRLKKIKRPQAHIPELHLFDPQARFGSLIERVRDLPQVRGGPPCDQESLKGALDAAAHGLVIPVLIAPAARLRALALEAGVSLDGVEIIDVAHSHAAAEVGAAMAGAGEVEILMKGSLHTDEMVHAVFATRSLRTKRRMSHVFRLDVPMYDKVLLVSDAALNIQPTLLGKADIVQNAIDLAHVLGNPESKVAILSALETVTPKIASTIDAAALCKMADRGQITGALLDGPLAFDNAVSPAAVRLKGIRSAVAGQADILIVPDLEAGNMLAKQLEYLAGASSCGVVLGATVPIALTSRAADASSKVASAAMALLLAHHYRLVWP